MNLLKKNIFIIAFSISIGFWMYYTAQAANYTLLQPFPEIQEVSTFGDYISRIIPFILMFAAVVAVVQIVIGGMEWALSESFLTKGEGKERITQALLGLFLALISWLVVYTINPDLVNFRDFSSSPGFGSNPTTPPTNPGTNPPTTGQTPRPGGVVQCITCRNGQQAGAATFGDSSKTMSELMTQCQQQCRSTAAGVTTQCIPSGQTFTCSGANPTSTPTPTPTTSSQLRCTIRQTNGTFVTQGPVLTNCQVGSNCNPPPNLKASCEAQTNQ